MTVSAHGKRHVYSGATRIGLMDYGPNHSPTFFNELYPHLRNASVKQLPLEQRIHDYLARRPGRTLSQIAAKVGGERRRVERRIEAHPELFRRQGKLWFVREGGK